VSDNPPDGRFIVGAARPFRQTRSSPAGGQDGGVWLGQLVGVALHFIGRAGGFSTPSAGVVEPHFPCTTAATFPDAPTKWQDLRDLCNWRSRFPDHIGCASWLIVESGERPVGSTVQPIVTVIGSIPVPGHSERDQSPISSASPRPSLPSSYPRTRDQGLTPSALRTPDALHPSLDQEPGTKDLSRPSFRAFARSIPTSRKSHFIVPN